MQIRTFDATSLERAQAAVREELGPDALILTIEETSTGIRMTAAIEPEDDLVDILGAAAPEPDPLLIPLLDFHGVPPGLRPALTVGGDADGLEAGLARALEAMLRTAAPAERRLLLGPPGHGKTLAAARLAHAYVAAGTRPRVVAVDLADDTADARLDAWLAGVGAGIGRHLAGAGANERIELVRVHDLQALEAAIAVPRPVIIDGPGLMPRSARGAAALGELVRRAEGAVATLVLSVEGQAAGLLELAVDFVALGCRCVLPTKLDLTRRYGGLLGLASGGIALLPASVSSSVAAPFAPLRPAGLARLLVKRFEGRSQGERAHGEGHRL